MRKMFNAFIFICLFSAIFIIIEKNLTFRGPLGIYTNRHFTRKITGENEILLFGNSHAFRGYIPDLIYNKTRLKPFLWASSGFNPDTIPIILKNTLKKRKVRYVIIELYTLILPMTNYNHSAHFNENIDILPYSRLKYELLKYKYGFNKGLLEKISPFIRYHFSYKNNEEMAKTLKFNSKKIKKTYDDWHTGEYDKFLFQERKNEIMEIVKTKNYWNNSFKISDTIVNSLKELKELKEKYGFKLIFTYNPMYACIEDPDYATKYEYFNDITTKLGADYFIDFNWLIINKKISNFELSDYMHEKDIRHNSVNIHTSRNGAIKVSTYLAQILNNIQNKKIDIYENIDKVTFDYNKQLNYANETTFDDYINKLQTNDNLLIFLSVNENIAQHWEKYQNILKKLGISKTLKGKTKYSFVAVTNTTGKVYYEKIDNKKIIATIPMMDNHRYLIESDCSNQKGKSSIMIDNKEYSLNKKGLNIVVYNKLEEKVTDQVTVVLFNQELLLLRK